METLLDGLAAFLLTTGVPMDVPAVFGAFHLVMLLVCVTLAVAAAYALRTQRKHALLRILHRTGWVLLILECYKQLFFFLVVDGRVYDFWIFPFQLCSVPLYLCLILPLLRGRAADTVLTFLWDYTFFGALLALLYPEGMMRPYLTLTLHGFVWHGILLFISLLILFSGINDRSPQAFLRATLLFLACCLVATFINCAAEGKGLPYSYPDMFYLSPYHATTQPVAHRVESALGRAAARILYVLVLIMLGAIDHFCSSRLYSSLNSALLPERREDK